VLVRCGLALATLVVPALLTVLLLRHPSFNPLVSFSYVLAVAVAAWVAGFWAGILVAAASVPLLVGIATGGRAFLAPNLDFPALGVFVLISLLSSRVAAARRRVEEVLRSSNEELEGRVRERTAELERARESLQTTLASIGDAVIATNTEGRIVFLNRVAQTLTGWTQDEALGRPLDEVFVIVNEETRGKVENPVTKVLQSGVSVGLANHTALVSREGRVLPIDDCAAPIRTASGAITGVVLVFRDMTERRKTEQERAQLEEQLRQAQKMEAIGRFAGGVAHDFNNLLTVINGHAAMTLEDLPANSPFRESIGEIATAGKRAGELTVGLLAFSRRQTLQLTVLDLNIVIRNIEKMLRRLLGEDVELVTNLAPGLWEVHADRGQLEQVIMNLAINARDAMPHGGTLTLETCNTGLNGTNQLDLQPGDYILLTVTDTGHGMEEKIRARIFDPFFTTKEVGKGTGLGLSTVYGIVKQTGGSISVRSEVGRGTSFQIYLPRQQDSVRQAQSAAAPAQTARRADRETILLVEDEEGVRKLTTSMLQRSGFRILTARNGEEALALCRRESGAIQIVLTDMVMPQMSGPQLAATIKAQYPEMKFVFMSGFSEHATVNQTVLDPDAAFVSKPFTAAGLVAKLHEVLGSGGRTRGLASGESS
jgi:two-component system, cell cycle sensor histidine kinase and response regulator CckA